LHFSIQWKESKQKGADFMDNSERLINELKNMDNKKLGELMQTASEALNNKQQKKLKSILRDKKKLESLKEKVSDDDIDRLINNLDSKEKLSNFLADDEIKAKIQRLLEQ
jgi:hypothetical protein